MMKEGKPSQNEDIESSEDRSNPIPSMGADLGLQSKQIPTLFPKGKSLPPYCFNYWLYGHKEVECRKLKAIQNNYDHLKPFIAEQKKKSQEAAKTVVLSQDPCINNSPKVPSIGNSSSDLQIRTHPK